MSNSAKSSSFRAAAKGPKLYTPDSVEMMYAKLIGHYSRQLAQAILSDEEMRAAGYSEEAIADTYGAIGIRRSKGTK